MFTVEQENRIEKARLFAHRMHEGQTYAGMPYSVHTDGVAALIRDAGGTPDQVSAGHLHDTWEDCKKQLFAEAASRFGQGVEDDLWAAVRTMYTNDFGHETTSIVVDVTDDPEWDELPKLIRKTMQADKFGNCAFGTKLVKLADCTFNMQTTAAGHDKPSWPTKKRRDYLEGNRRVAFACRGVSPSLDRAFEHAFRGAYKRYYGV